MKYLNKNIASHSLWEESFIGKLLEECVWDKDEFWHLHAEITRYSIEHKNDKFIPREIASEVARMIFLILKTYAGSKESGLEGVNDEELHELIERVELLSLAFFSGNIVAEDEFDLKNPYLLNFNESLD